MKPATTAASAAVHPAAARLAALIASDAMLLLEICQKAIGCFDVQEAADHAHAAALLTARIGLAADRIAVAGGESAQHDPIRWVLWHDVDVDAFEALAGKAG